MVTMRVHVVAAAILFALALVDWQKPAANGPKLSGTGKRSKVHGPGSKVPMQSKMSKSRKCDDKKLMQALCARWLLPSSKKPNSKVIQSKAKAKPARFSGQFLAFRGTGWG